MGNQYFGGDPELFVVNSRSNKIISSHRFLTPAAEKRINGNPDYYGEFGAGKVKRDGAAVEIELGPSYCRDWVVPKTFYFIAEMLKAAKTAGFPNVKVVGKPVAELTMASIRNAPEDIMILGCNPDYSAYSQGPKAPELADGDKRRYTGGHLHFDYTGRKPYYMQGKKDGTFDCGDLDREQRLEHAAAAAVVLDYVIGLPSVAVLGEKHAAGEAERRLKYGQAGSYRIPKHGIEYRVLSGNGAMLHPVLLTLWVGMGRRFNDMDHKSLVDVVNAYKKHIPIDDMRAAIDNHDYSSAWNMVLDGHWKNAIDSAYVRPVAQ